MPKHARLSCDELAEFIGQQMSMSHVYQPLLIRSLIDAGGAATVRQIAISFATNDEAVLIEAEKTIKKMPVPVLRRRGIVSVDSDSGLVSLNVEALTFEQKARLRALCEQRLGDYLEQRGLAIWDYRLIDDSAVSGDLRYRVLAASDRRCALCGATEKERPLDIDHIVPRSRGGTNEEANLQVLCSKCNRAKGNRDARDFRVPVVESDPDCVFCSSEFVERAIEQTERVIAVADHTPVADGHMLVVPRRHTPDMLSMTQAERAEADDLLRLLSGRARAEDPSIEGFNVGANCGPVAGQTIAHAHLHLIPRRKGDVADPTGGVRGVIPDRRVPI